MPTKLRLVMGFVFVFMFVFAMTLTMTASAKDDPCCPLINCPATGQPWIYGTINPLSGYCEWDASCPVATCPE